MARCNFLLVFTNWRLRASTCLESCSSSSFAAIPALAIRRAVPSALPIAEPIFTAACVSFDFLAILVSSNETDFIVPVECTARQRARSGTRCHSNREPCGSLVDIFHEYNFVMRFVIEQFIHARLRH